ncbi:energy transducer TonB [Hymenobacter lapidiphilus]|uniref:Energy transducer TonB n=1 Tax=Hymenobacter lapidiphilus TaxID=2608003 RepID=A0A7Y7U6N9_9BACT|nr:energy transducer TonB [Hymenobacter lapidiphilus]NVO32607.1 energy transducer TonB [Hymenobacter lapidiphilus]
MLPLPVLHVRLRACSESWTQMTPAAQGQHCARCNRTVLDFTQSSAADLEAAFQASPDGRVCGQFHPAQLAPNQPAPLPPRPALRPKLRRFLVALVLVCGLGLGAQEAVAQVRQKLPTTSPLPRTDWVSRPYGDVAERLPVFQGGPQKMMQFIGENLRYPAGLTESGRVFVRFTVDEAGNQQNVRVVKGFHPDADAEALRVVSMLKSWTPGSQSGRPVAVEYNVPITFSME